MESLKYLLSSTIPLLKHTIRDCNLTIQASARLQRLSRCGGTTTSQKARKPITPSIHRLISRTSCLGAHSALISPKVVNHSFDSLFVFLRWFTCAPAANPRRHVVTRRAFHPPSRVLILSPLTFVTAEVSVQKTTKNALYSLCVDTPRGIIPVSEPQIVESPELCW